MMPASFLSAARLYEPPEFQVGLCPLWTSL